MKLFNEHEKELLSSAFLEYAKELPSDEELQSISFSDGFCHRMAKAIRRQKTAVLRRAVAICACLAVIITAVAFYQKPYQPIVPPPYTQDNAGGDSCIVPIELNMSALKDFADEFFIAKVVSNPKVTVDVYNEFDQPYQNPNLIPTLCNVKITKLITSDMLTEGKKVKLFNYVYDFGKSYGKTLEKGKTYLFATNIEAHDGSAVTFCRLAAEIDGDKLIAMNSFTKDILAEIDTLTQFLDNEHVKALEPEKDIHYSFERCIIKTKNKIYTRKYDEVYYKKRIKESLKPGAKRIFTRVTRPNDEFDVDIYVLESLFTAKVIKREKEIKESGWVDHPILKGTPVLYHVEIQDNMWSFFEGKPTVKLVYYEDGEQLEIGQTYLFSAYTKPLDNSAVLVERNTCIAKVDGKKLIPISEKSKINLKGLDTIKKFKNSNSYLALTLEFFYNNDSPDSSFENYIAKQGDTSLTTDDFILGSSEKEYNEYLDRLNRYLEMIAEAIKVGSDVTITKMEG